MKKTIWKAETQEAGARPLHLPDFLRSKFPKLLSAFLLSAILADAAPDVRTADLASWQAWTKAEIEAGRLPDLRQTLATALAAGWPGNRVEAADVENGAASLAVAQHEFLRQVGGVSMSAVEGGRREFLAWLLNDRDALEAYLTAADLVTPKRDRTRGLEGWNAIWAADPASRTNGPWLRAAAAIAVSFAESRGKNGEDIAPEDRYRFFKSETSAGRILPYFLRAPAWELVLTVHGDSRPNDELEWALDITPTNSRNQKAVGNVGHATMAYRLHNYRAESIHGRDYYDDRRNSLQLQMEYGGVCGAISHQNSSIANAHGIPAFTVGQPGHCAYVYKSDDTTWSGGNFVSGWATTHDSHQQPFPFSRHSANVNALSAAFNHPGFLVSERLRWLSAALPPAGAAAALQRATKADPLHPVAWSDRIAAATAQTIEDPAKWREMAAGVIVSFTNFPVIMVELLAPVEATQLWPRFSDNDRIAYAAGVVRAIGCMPGDKQWDLDDPALRMFLQRQLTLMGIGDRSAAALLEGRIQKFRPAGAKEDATPWQAIPADRRAFIERYFHTLSDAAESKADSLRAIATAYLALTSEDPAAGGRALAYFRDEISSTARLDRLEPIAAATLGALRSSLDQRADFVDFVRQRIAKITSFDTASLQRLQGLLNQYDFRPRGIVGRWQPTDFATGGDQERTLAWNVSSTFSRAADDYLIHLSFRWETGKALTVASTRLLENGKEISADKRKAAIDESRLPAVYSLALKDPKSNATYTIEAVVTGGGKDSGGLVLGRGERQPAFEKDEFVGLGSWGGKTWQDWPEVSEGWHEATFDLTPHVKKAGTLFVRFQYGSYANISMMNARLFEDGRQIAQDMHVGHAMGNAQNQFALSLPAHRAGARYTVKALLRKADGYGTVYLRKQ